MAVVAIVRYQQVAIGYHASRVKKRQFEEGDWVFKQIVKNQKKFNPSWEGPYEIAKPLGLKSYILRHIHGGKQLPWTWNTINLKKYYV